MPLARLPARQTSKPEEIVQYTFKLVLNRAFWLLALCQVVWAVLAIGRVLAAA